MMRRCPSLPPPGRPSSPAPSRTCLRPLQHRHQTPQGVGVEAASDFNPAAAIEDHYQLAGVAIPYCYFNSNPLRRPVVAILFPAEPYQVPRQGLQRHTPLIAKLLPTEPTRFILSRQPVGFLSASPTP